MNYFHCPEAQTTPVGNLSVVVDNAVAWWDQEAPSTSVADGYGCAYANTYVASGAGYRTIYDALFEGSFTGNIDSLTVRAYATLLVGQVRAPAQITVHLGIDGVSMFGEDASATGDPAPGIGTVEVTPQAQENGLSLVEFTITGLGFTQEDGEGAVEHDVQLTLNAWDEVVNLFVLDVIEAPSSLEFNSATPADAALAATTPGPSVA
ncbi:MAG: hypothetical protein WDA27_14030 [Actinomycetota bacterium]